VASGPISIENLMSVIFLVYFFVIYF